MAKITVKAVTVTPKLATEWLELNKNNRTIRDRHVDALARDMAEGRWKMNGDTIRFDRDGNLADGQHRLWAILQSGTSQKMLVVEGISPESFDTIDNGSVRTGRDALQRQGFKNATTVAAAARALRWWDAGHKRGYWTNKARMTNAEISEVVAGYPDLPDAVMRIKNNSALNRMPFTTALVLITFLGRKHFPELIETFLGALETGEGLKVGDPRLTLRNWMFEARTRGVRYEIPAQVAIIVKAFNAYATGNVVRQVSFRANEDVPSLVKKSEVQKQEM